VPVVAAHLATGLHAAPARLGALAYDRVVGELLARARAAAAGVRAAAAVELVQRRGAQHQVPADVAGLGAVEQRPDELGRGVLAAALQAVLQRGRAQVMAVRAIGDAVVHRLVDVLDAREVMAHLGLLSG